MVGNDRTMFLITQRTVTQ